MAESSIDTQWQDIQTKVREALSENFPVEGRKNQLVLHDIKFDEASANHADIHGQEQAKLNGRTWGVPVYGEVGLIDKTTGKEIDRAKIKLLTLPKPTYRYSFIVDGNERQVDNLWRLRSGVYAHIKQNGEHRTEFNLKEPFARSPRIYIPFDPENKKFKLNYGDSNIPLYPILKVLGVDDVDMKKQWGDAIYKENAVPEKKIAKTIEDLYSKISDKGYRAASDKLDDKAAVIYKAFHDAKLLPETTKTVFGKPFDSVNGEALLLASKRILDVSRGDIPPDDRDSLVFKTLHSVDDFLKDSLTKYQAKKIIKQKLSNNIDRQEKVRDIISGDIFHKPIHKFFSEDTLSRNAEQVNPLEILSNYRATTIVSKDSGGIKNERSLTDSMKLINPSHFGFLDVIHTPESEKTGITLHLPLGVKKEGDEAKTQVYDLKEGRLRFVSPAEFHAENVVLPDQVIWKDQKPHPVNGTEAKMKDPKTHEMVMKPFSQGRFLVLSPHQLFDESTNLIPFLQNNQGNRTMVAAKQLSQAVSLHHRESPLVQVSSGNQTWERIVGGRPWSNESPVTGKISELKRNPQNGHVDQIVVSGEDGSKHAVQLYNHFPLNDSKSFLHNEPLVAKGDTVKKGQVIADSNFTRDGNLALGTNLRVSYLPYKGYNFEDGIVISESAAKKLTSEHVHRHSIEIDPERDHVDKKKFLAYSSTLAKQLTKEQAAKIGDDGIVHVGVRVKPGDTLIAAVGKKDLSGETARAIGRLDKKMFAYEDKSVVWDSQHEGEVVKVLKNPNGKGTTVYVKTLEPAEIGDKMVGRHGNKGIITKILPDAEMPKIGSAEGKHVEVLLNPSGVTTRINLGQMLETAAAKIAEKTGKPYLVHNFSSANTDYTEKVRQDLESHGLSDTEAVYDPITGKKLGDALTGPQYILKLKHQVEKKLSVRGGDPTKQSYTLDMAPRGTGAANPGQAIGQLEMYSLLAHGARANLREMATYKTSKQSTHPKDDASHIDFWHRVMTGQPLPAPQAPFAYKKFEAMLTGLGVNIKKEGNELVLQPLTDKGVLALSNGEIQDAGRILRGKDAKELEKGLFDPKITGGLPTDVGKGTKWSHIVLPEPVVNPVFLGTSTQPGPAVVLTGMKFADFEEIARGKKAVNGLTGGKAIESLLKKIDVKSEINSLKEKLPSLRGTELDKSNRKMKYLTALDHLGMKPTEAYMMNVVPVLPPVFRPMTSMPNGEFRFDDINHHYKSLGHIVQQLKTAPKELGDDVNTDLRDQLYDAVTALSGVPGARPLYDSNRKMKGILETISGENQPKEGFFQRRLMKRRQDLSMRSTIIPEPAMHLDHVGLPKDAAMEFYKPFVIREMQGIGYNPIQALKEIKQSSPVAWKALNIAMDKRPVLLKRDPALHKFSIMAFKPKAVEGKAIKIHPLVTAGFNADFDGDSCLGPILTCTLQPSDLSEDMPHTNQIAAYQVIEIRDFPRIIESAVVKESGVTEYDVPSTAFVPAYLNGEMKILPVTKFSIHPSCEEWIVKSRNGREMKVSSDHSLALLDPETLSVTKMPPRDSVGRCFPIMRSLDDPGLYSHFQGHTLSTKGNSRAMKDAIPLDGETGWFIGATIGDGWVSGDHVAFASGRAGAAVKNEWSRIATLLSCGAKISDRITTHEFDGSICQSTKTIVSSTALSRWVYPMIGRGALNKHLPQRFLEMPMEFRRGILAGLLDTDGAVNWNRRGQFQCQYTTVSDQLSGEIMLLAMSLGLICNRTESENREKPAYTLSFSIRPMQEATWLKLFSPHKQGALEELHRGHQIEYGRTDFVPMTEKIREELLSHLRDMGAAVRPPARNSSAFSLYVILKRKEPTITRETASQLFKKLESKEQSTYLANWFSLVLNSSIGWDVIEEASATGQTVEMYDLTVPDAWTFTMANGAVVWDTMSAFLPLTDEAVLEAQKMFPSNNLFSSTNYKIMYAPEQESLLGLHLMSKWGNDSGKSFVNSIEAMKAKDKGLINVTDVIKIGNKPPTTLGRLLIADHMPDSVKEDKDFMKRLLEDSNLNIVKNDKGGKHTLGLHNLLEHIATKDPKSFAGAVDKLKDLGNQYSYELGFSIGLKDLHVNKELRDGIMKKYDAEANKVRADQKLTTVQKNEQLVDIYTKATTELVKTHEPYFEKQRNNIYAMVASGARGNMAQFRQMSIAPMLMKDGSGNTLPTPVKRSYSEGLDVGDYWTSLHGARMGTLQRVEGTSEPGRLTKEIVNVVIPHMIVSSDCGTTQGVSMNVAEKDIHDRFLASSVKLPGGQVLKENTLLTPEIISTLQKHKIDNAVVRSPLKCNHGVGICSKCYGLNENGRLHEVGTNIGVIAGQALGEPAIQLTMDSFHSGGTAASRGGGSVDKFTRLNQLLEIPQILPNAAVLAKASGKIQKVERDPGTNGWNVFIGGDRHFISAKHTPTYEGQPLKVGLEVKRGRPISNGPVDPRELLEHTDIHTVQNYITDELHNGIYKSEGVRRRNIETVVRALTNRTKIIDPGDSDHLHGDYALRTVVEDHNRNLPQGAKPIIHKPLLQGAQQMARDQHEDWMARLNFQKLKDTVLEGAAKGWRSNLSGTNPIPAYAHGQTFGASDPKNPHHY